jgi:hypothetical protein
MCVYLDTTQCWNISAIFISRDTDREIKTQQLRLGIETFRAHVRMLMKDITHTEDIKNFVRSTDTCFDVLRYW